MPSTSTGITSSNSENILFRIAQRQIDSDDELSSHNSPTPTLRINYQTNVAPVNGKRKINPSSNEDDNRDEILNKKIRIKRNRASYNNNDIYSSHSNSRLSNSSYQEDGSSNDSMNNYFNNKTKSNGTTGEVTATNGNENNESNIYKTPNKSHEILSFTPDSGIVTAPGSSTSTVESNIKNTSTVEKNGNSLKLFKDGVTRVRRNYRNTFGDDSDSD